MKEDKYPHWLTMPINRLFWKNPYKTPWHWNPTKGTIESRMRKYVWDRDRYICHYCGEDMYLPYMRWKYGHRIKRLTSNLTADHVIPLRRGGSNDLDNLIPACTRCNFGWRRAGRP